MFYLYFVFLLLTYLPTYLLTYIRNGCMSDLFNCVNILRASTTNQSPDNVKFLDFIWQLLLHSHSLPYVAASTCMCVAQHCKRNCSVSNKCKLQFTKQQYLVLWRHHSQLKVQYFPATHCSLIPASFPDICIVPWYLHGYLNCCKFPNIIWPLKFSCYQTFLGFQVFLSCSATVKHD